MRFLVLALCLVAGCGDSLTGEDAHAGDVAAVTVGKPAPDFALPDLDGKTVRLSDSRGKWVVLEWYNPDCPYVVHAHKDGPLATLPAKWTEKGVVWLAINSGSPGKQGAGVDRNRKSLDEYGIRYPILLDEKGDTGRAYGAKNTPTIYVIDPAGTLVYAGGLDNAPLGKVDGGGAAKRYADEVLAAVTAGQPSPYTQTKPYGCSVKY